LIAAITGAGLPGGVEKSLVANLKQIDALLTDGNPNNDGAACGKLAAFIDKVNAKEANGQLAPALGASLRQTAEAIGAAIGCA
jgi:hypothetical protein